MPQRAQREDGAEDDQQDAEDARESSPGPIRAAGAERVVRADDDARPMPNATNSTPDQKSFGVA